MAGTAPTDFHLSKTLDAVPVHCSGWLSGRSGCQKNFNRGSHG
jgi:hypothetical protein